MAKRLILRIDPRYVGIGQLFITMSFFMITMGSISIKVLKTEEEKFKRTQIQRLWQRCNVSEAFVKRHYPETYEVVEPKRKRKIRESTWCAYQEIL